MNNPGELTQELALTLFNYDPMSGIVVSKVRRSSILAGTVVGCRETQSSGYKRLTVSVNYRAYLLHRVIWLIKTGNWPEEIDHINGNPTDNRWSNLRSVSRSVNGKNLARHKSRKYGVTGVYKRSGGTWRATIMANGKNLHLYNGNEFFEACCARKSAEVKYGFSKNHGLRYQNGEAL